jgi:hypothetical protein
MQMTQAVLLFVCLDQMLIPNLCHLVRPFASSKCLSVATTTATIPTTIATTTTTTGATTTT